MTDAQQLLTLVGIAVSAGAAYVWPSGQVPSIASWVKRSPKTAAEMQAEIERLRKQIADIEAEAETLAESMGAEVERLKEVAS